MTSTRSAAHLRLVQPGDAARLASLMRRLFLEAYPDCSAPSNVQAYLDTAFGETQQAAELAAPDRRTWVLADGDDWLGFAQLRFPAPIADGVTLAHPAQLHRIYLARAATGRGLGLQLLDAVRDAARSLGADGLWLSVWQQAPGPVAFYERHGFRIVGCAVFQVGDEPLDDWIMQAHFDAPV